MAKKMDIPPSIDRTISGSRIQADQEAVKAWLAMHSPVKIDLDGCWRRDGVVMKKRPIPAIPTSPFNWGKMERGTERP